MFKEQNKTVSKEIKKHIRMIPLRRKYKTEITNMKSPGVEKCNKLDLKFPEGLKSRSQQE